MKNLMRVLGGVTAASAAVIALGIGSGNAAPGNTNSTLNVVGEPYAKAVAILRAQGVPAVFGGSVGSDLPQAQCIVSSQKVLSTRKIELMLNCTDTSPHVTAGTAGTPSTSAQSTEAARPTPGAPGVVTVVPTPVG